MTNILHITASIRKDDSVSTALGNALTAGLAAKSGATITARDLSDQALPFVSEDRFAAGLTPAAERTADQAELAEVGDILIAELQAADTIVISSPMYNFGAPASLKAWADLVARAGTTFKYTENGPVGLLEGKTAYIAAASGGTPVGGDMDFMSNWLTFFLGFLGVKDVQIIAADGIMGTDGADKIAAAHARIADITA
ncbi:NAD(P)H-dependent oxidoreductase [Erythrobacter sp. Alg231-14]|uniref:NAD(P)H-dependent oxidoreductase n=1 Tax=Erythrobacter sp. Alg231-14 TaxID=1922225 RepID=UPI000D54D37F